MDWLNNMKSYSNIPTKATERQIRLLLQEINTNIPKEQLKLNLVMEKLLEVRKIVKEKLCLKE